MSHVKEHIFQSGLGCWRNYTGRYLVSQIVLLVMVVDSWALWNMQCSSEILAEIFWHILKVLKYYESVSWVVYCDVIVCTKSRPNYCAPILVNK